MASRLIYWLRSVRPGEIKKQLRVRVCEDARVWGGEWENARA